MIWESINLRVNHISIKKLSKVLIKISIPPNIDISSNLRWKKLIWNMAFNRIAVVHNKSTTGILNDKTAFGRLTKIMNEVVISAENLRIDIPENFISDIIEFTSKMEDYYPSMKLDFDYNREMELEYMYQRPLQIVRNAGRRTPMIEAEKVSIKNC